MRSGVGQSKPFVVGAEACDDPRLVGGKAASLARLRRSGLPIPPWVVVLPEALVESLDPTARRLLSDITDDASVPESVHDVAPSHQVCSELAECLSAIADTDDLLAVRSSAVDEDGVERSFAGQLESFLFVRREDVPDRVARVWRSGYNARVLAYRREHGLPPSPQPPSVIVQRMIAADVAGVVFGADPVSGGRDIAVVSAVFGLGTSLVSGESDADCWRVDTDDRIVERVVARKSHAHRAAAGTLEGVTREPLPTEDAEGPTLSDQQIREVANLVRRCGDVLGMPQDVEWAISGGALWLLQSRPITAMGRGAPPSGVLNVWDNSNIAESYSGVTTPLTFSFARHAYEGVYREFCRFMGVTPSKLAGNDLVFRRMLGLIRGRVYYNMESWYRTLALLPGFTVNRRFMEQMMGVREGLPDAVLADLERASWSARAADALDLARSTAGLVRNHLFLRRTVARFYRRLNAALGSQPPPLGGMRAEELAGHYLGLERTLLKRWDAPLINDFFAMVFHGILRGLSKKWFGDRAPALQNDLLRGEPGMISVEPARRLREMATVAARSPDLVDTLCAGSLDEIERALFASPNLHRLYLDYLDRFGDRCLEELKLESPTLHDDPLPLLRSVGQMARRYGTGVPAGDGESKVRAAAEKLARDLLGRHILRRTLFFWVLRQVRTLVRNRENLRFERTRLFGRVRRIFVELGRRLHEAGCLDDPRDVFWLEVDEVLGFLDGTATTTDLRGLAAVRRSEFLRHREGPAPGGRFETRGMVHVGNTFAGQTSPIAYASGEERKGLGLLPRHRAGSGSGREGSEGRTPRSRRDLGRAENRPRLGAAVPGGGRAHRRARQPVVALGHSRAGAWLARRRIGGGGHRVAP
jgi:pyruvate,water dikinase